MDSKPYCDSGNPSDRRDTGESREGRLETLPKTEISSKIKHEIAAREMGEGGMDEGGMARAGNA